jgi:Uncharacterized protein conserved in bacteria (DUF2188)
VKSKSLHVLPRNGKWSVYRTGVDRAVRVFVSLTAAENFARRKAQEQQTELYVHGLDGRIRKRSSFALSENEPLLASA